MSKYRKAAIGFAFLIVLSGCAGKSEEPGVASAGGAQAHASKSASVDYAAFEKCLREQGVDTEALRTGSGDMATIEEASKACRQHLPDGGELPKLAPQEVEQLRAYAACMRRNGIPDFPDPAPDGAVDKITPPAATQEQMQESARLCAKHIPQAGGGKG